MNEQLDNRVEGIITGLKKQRPRNHPILEHPVSEVEEYVQKLYIDALCVVAQYANENADERLAFVERIHSGVGLNDEFPEHIKNAMNITPEKFEEFFAQCRENALENIFVLDCLLIAGADGVPNSKQIGFAVEIAEALGMTKDNISLMCELAITILEQDNDKYHEVCEKIPAEDVMNIVGGAICYVKEFASGVLIDTSELLWISSTEQMNISLYKRWLNGLSRIEEGGKSILINIIVVNHKKVIIENMTIDMPITIENCGNIFLIKCRITNSFDLEIIASCTVKNCIFDLTSFDYKGELFKLAVVNDFNFVENEVFNYDMGHSGRLFCAGNGSCENFKIERSFFCNINRFSGAVIFDNKLESSIWWAESSIWCKNAMICDSKFSSCLGDYLFKDYKDGLSLENNTYENCCEVLG